MSDEQWVEWAAIADEQWVEYVREDDMVRVNSRINAHKILVTPSFLV
jgi:hypothetical protein